jgi:hypothetical protein
LRRRRRRRRRSGFGTPTTEENYSPAGLREDGSEAVAKDGTLRMPGGLGESGS